MPRACTETTGEESQYCTPPNKESWRKADPEPAVTAVAKEMSRMNERKEETDESDEDPEDKE